MLSLLQACASWHTYVSRSDPTAFVYGRALDAAAWLCRSPLHIEGCPVPQGQAQSHGLALECGHPHRTVRLGVTVLPALLKGESISELWPCF